MAIIYDKVAKKNPINKSVKWYASVKTIKQVDDKEVARLIADETTLNPKEAEMAIAQFAGLRFCDNYNSIPRLRFFFLRSISAIS